VAKDGGIYDVDRTTVRVRQDLIEDVGELQLVFVLRHVPNVRRADDVRQVRSGSCGSRSGSVSYTSTAAKVAVLCVDSHAASDVALTRGGHLFERGVAT
jgi:hypothetical protein